MLHFLPHGNCLHQAVVAVIIIFHGSIVSWWPFIKLGAVFVVTILRPASLSVVSFHSVLHANSETAIYLYSYHPVPSLDHTIAVHSHDGYRLQSYQRFRGTNFSGSLITSEGVVARQIPPATLQLDDALLLHLGDFDTTTAGRLPGRAFAVVPVSAPPISSS